MSQSRWVGERRLSGNGKGWAQQGGGTGLHPAALVPRASTHLTPLPRAAFAVAGVPAYPAAPPGTGSSFETPFPGPGRADGHPAPHVAWRSCAQLGQHVPAPSSAVPAPLCSGPLSPAVGTRLLARPAPSPDCPELQWTPAPLLLLAGASAVIRALQAGTSCFQRCCRGTTDMGSTHTRVCKHPWGLTQADAGVARVFCVCRREVS